MNENASHVLVVDDEPLNRLLYRKALAQVPGVQVGEAGSGLEALAALDGQDVDLVLLDVMMPGMDGFEVAREILRRKEEAAPPIVFVTAFDPSEQARLRGFEEGGLDFFYKPIDLELLKRKVRALLRIQRQRVELDRERREVGALLATAKDVMAHRDFPAAARKIFNRCKEIVGARDGYMALLSRDGRMTERLFLDGGGVSCALHPELPMPVRGLRETACAERRPVYENDFPRSRWMEFLPEGHVQIENVLLAPLVIGDATAGLLGLANKPGGFGEQDLRLSGAFGELAALALHNARALEALNRANRLMGQASDLSRLGSFEWDSAGDEMFWTHGLYAALGVAEGRDAPTLGDFWAGIHEQDRGPVREALERAAAGGQKVEMEFRGSAGKDSHVFQFQARTLVGPGQGKVVIGACQDITPIKEMEARAMHAQKLDSLGQLAAGLAHEMNTPLQYLTGNLDFIRNAFAKTRDWRRAGREDAEQPDRETALPEELGPKVAEAIKDCDDGLRRIQATIKSLLRFSRSNTQGVACCDVNTMVEDAVSISRSSWEDVAEMRLDLAGDMPKLSCIPGEISNCLLNLVLNAAEAIRSKPRAPGEKGVITVGTRREHPGLHIWVADTGTGIPEAIRSKIFNPFFTTREVGQGTGMGLALAHAAVRALGGELNFETTEGQGANFHIHLPMGGE